MDEGVLLSSGGLDVDIARWRDIDSVAILAKAWKGYPWCDIGSATPWTKYFAMNLLLIEIFLRGKLLRRYSAVQYC